MSAEPKIWVLFRSQGVDVTLRPVAWWILKPSLEQVQDFMPTGIPPDWIEKMLSNVPAVLSLKSTSKYFKQKYSLYEIPQGKLNYEQP